MPFDRDKIFKEAEILSKQEDFYFIQDIIDFLVCGKTTFYTSFPDGSHELNALKDNLFKNRIIQKQKLRKRLSEGSGSELIAMYKLIGNDEERKALSTNWNNAAVEVEIKKPFTLTINDEEIDL